MRSIKPRRQTSVLLLTLMVAVPISILTYFGVRLERQESSLIEADFDKFTKAQLQNINGQFSTYFESLGSQLQDHLPIVSSKDARRVRQLLKNSAYIRNIYISTAEAERIFPPKTNLSADDTAFLQRTRNLWLEQQIFNVQTENPAGSEQTAPLYKRSYLPNLKSAKQAPHREFVARNSDSSTHPASVLAASGWYTWYVNSGTSFIYWMRDGDDTLYAFELFSARIVSDLINFLPSQSEASEALPNATIQLVNEKYDNLYQWGDYSTEQQQPRQRLYLTHPLGSWKLLYYSEGIQYNRPSQTFSLFLIIVAIALVLAGLAFYFYREQFREIDLARQRVNFVNQVSHELKTPLTNIRMYAELMEQETDTGDDFARHLNVIATESQRLSRLIDNVLNFSRSQRNNISVHKQNCHADGLIERVIQAFMPAMENAGIEVQFTANADQNVMLDAEIVEQILNNLLSNAEKYAALGKRLEIHSEISGDCLRVTLRDYGMGIKSQHRQMVFEPFYRVSSRVTDGVSGTGIGLSIAKELAQLHGGDLHLADDSVDVPGCCFQLTLNVKT